MLLLLLICLSSLELDNTLELWITLYLHQPPSESACLGPSLAVDAV